MRSRIVLQGEENILTNLEFFIAEANAEATQVIEKNAEYLRDFIEELTPRGKRDKKGKYPHKAGTLQDSIHVGFLGKKDGWRGTRIGVEKNKIFTQKDGYYARFVHDGTENFTGFFYLTLALKKKRNKIKKNIENTLRARLFAGG